MRIGLLSRPVLIIFVVIALFVVACGTGEDDDEEDQPNPTVPTFPTATVDGIQEPTGGPSQPTAVADEPAPTRFGGFPTLAVAPTIPPRYPNNIQIVSPVTGAELQGSETIFGSASHPAFVQYTLEYGPDPNPSNLWYPITPQAVTVPVLNNALGTWNTTLVPDGSYQIRLHVYLTDNTEITNVRVTGLQVRNQVAPTQVAQANSRPQISPVPSINLQAGASTTIALGMSDPDGDALSVDASSDSPNIATVTSAGQSITVNAVAPGIATLRVEVTDGRGGQASTSFLVNVNPAPITNQAPVIDPIPSQIISQGSTIQVPLNINDPDGDVVNVTVQSSAPSLVQAADRGSGSNVIDLIGAQPGSTTVTVEATDSEGATSRAVFAVVVNPTQETANNPPTIAAIPSQILEVGQQRDLQLSISDPDNDTTTINIQNSAPNVVSVETLQNNTLRLRGINAGQATVMVIVRDQEGSSVTTQFNVSVTQPPPPNRAPTIAPIPSQSLTVGDLADIDLTMSDPDGDSITFSVTSSAPEVVLTGPLDDDTVRLLGVSEGTAVITVSIGDGQGGSDSTTFSVTVEPAEEPNQPPEIQDIPAQSVEAGETIVVPVNASDPDPEDTLTLSTSSTAADVATVYQSAPGELTVTGITAGEATLSVVVEDGRGGVAETSFPVTVTAANRRPNIAPIPSQQCLLGDTLRVAMAYEDPDGDSVTITVASNQPAVVTAQQLDVASLQVNCLAPGEATLTVQASDGRGGTREVSFLVVVNQPNRDPSIAPVQDQRIETGETSLVDLEVTDPDNDDLAVNAVSADPDVLNVVVLSLSQLQISGVSAGTTTVEVSVNDGRGGEASTSFAVEVVEVNQDPTIAVIPAVALTTGEAMTVNLDVRDPNGDSLTTEAVADDDNVATVSVLSATELEVTGVAPGTTSVTVTVRDGRGGSAQAAFNVEV
ncbi:MAG: hypothetical protein GYB66_10995, partial [Chloroflexi bacterium]|nr:hypothetical protein [Chloroflexota bacterium]